MKKIIVVIASLLFIKDSRAQINQGAGFPRLLLQSPFNFGASPLAVTLTKPTIKGSLLIAAVLSDNGVTSFSSITDGGDVFIQVPRAQATDGTSHITDIWFCPNSKGGATTLTATNGVLNVGVQLFEVIGMGDYTAEIDTVTSKSSGASSTSATGNPTSTRFIGSFGVASLCTGGAAVSVARPWQMGTNPNTNGIAFYGSTNSVTTNLTNGDVVTFTQTAGTYCLSEAFFVAKRRVSPVMGF